MHHQDASFTMIRTSPKRWIETQIWWQRKQAKHSASWLGNLWFSCIPKKVSNQNCLQKGVSLFLFVAGCVTEQLELLFACYSFKLRWGGSSQLHGFILFWDQGLSKWDVGDLWSDGTNLGDVAIRIESLVKNWITIPYACGLICGILWEQLWRKLDFLLGLMSGFFNSQRLIRYWQNGFGN